MMVKKDLKLKILYIKKEIIVKLDGLLLGKINKKLKHFTFQEKVCFQLFILY